MTDYKKILVEYFLIAATWLLTYFAPVFPLILAIGFLVACDLLTGLIKAKKEGGWCNIKSRKMRATISKFIVYGVSVMVAHVMEKTFLPDFPAMRVVSGLIALIELKSMDENIKEITGVSLFGKLLELLNLKTK